MKSYEGRKYIFFTCFCLYLIAFSFISGCGGNVSKKVAFSQSDSEGFWKMVCFGYQQYGPFSCAGSLIFGAPGNVTGGDVNNFGVDVENFTGGTLEITSEGAVRGVIDTLLADSDTTEKYRILGGQMTFDKNMIAYAGKFPIDNKGIGILVKKSGSFSISDLEGTWNFPLEGMFSVSVNSYGIITDCMYLPVEGSAGRCKGNFSVAREGSVAGEIETINGKPFKINFDGQMNSSKDRMILAGGISTRFEGIATFVIKKSGSFSSVDIQGKWKILRAAYKDTMYGEIVVERSGTVTGGNWTKVDGGSGTYSGGQISVDEKGNISGFIHTSTASTYTIHGGQMTAGRDSAACLDRDNSGFSGVLILVKIP